MKEHSGKSFTSKQWEKAFAHASVWTTVTAKFGKGFLLYLPIEDKIFANSWYISKNKSPLTIGWSEPHRKRGNGF